MTDDVREMYIAALRRNRWRRWLDIAAWVLGVSALASFWTWLEVAR